MIALDLLIYWWWQSWIPFIIWHSTYRLIFFILDCFNISHGPIGIPPRNDRTIIYWCNCLLEFFSFKIFAKCRIQVNRVLVDLLLSNDLLPIHVQYLLSPVVLGDWWNFHKISVLVPNASTLRTFTYKVSASAFNPRYGWFTSVSYLINIFMIVYIWIEPWIRVHSIVEIIRIENLFMATHWRLMLDWLNPTSYFTRRYLWQIWRCSIFKIEIEGIQVPFIP